MSVSWKSGAELGEWDTILTTSVPLQKHAPLCPFPSTPARPFAILPPMNLILTTATRYGLNILALLGGTVALYLGRSIFIPLIIAALLASILWPWARFLNRRMGLPWFVSCCSAIGVLVFLHLAVFTLIALAIPQMISDLPAPNDLAKQKEMYAKLRTGLQNISPVLLNDTFPKDPDDSGFFQQIRKYLTGDYITNALLELVKLGASFLWQGVLILFILLFLLLEGEMLARKVRNIFGPGPQIQHQVTSAFKDMADAVRSYLVWRTLVNFGLGLALGIFYYSLGLKQPLLWAVLTFILCYVPYLGTIAAGIPPVIDALVYTEPGVALLIILVYCAVVTFEGYIIVPWVMGKSMDLNATTVLIGCLFWDLVWGTSGLFLAMPLLAAIKAVCIHVEGWSAWGHLMSSEPMPVAVPRGDKIDLEKVADTIESAPDPERAGTTGESAMKSPG